MSLVSCVGNITQDHLFYVEDIPQLDDVAYINKRIQCIGGRGALVSIILAQLGTSVSLCTCVGGGTSSSVFDFLESAGVNTATIYRDSTRDSIFDVYIVLSKKDQNSISFFSPKNIDFVITPQHIDSIRESRIVYFSTHKKRFNLALLDICNPMSQKIVHNFSKYFIDDEVYRRMLLQKSHVLIGNHIESSYLLKKLHVDNTENLLSAYPNIENMIVTYGDQGSTIYTRGNKPFHVPIEQTVPLTPVGAGDAYAAGIVFGLSKGLSMEKSMRIASFIASKSVSSEFSYPNLDTLRTDVNSFLSKMDIEEI